MRMNAKQLRCTPPTPEQMKEKKLNPIYIVLDNVLDTYNIGAIFRIADAVAATEVILCGGSETPPSSRIHKAAVGTEEWVKWRYEKEIANALKALRDREPNIKIIAVEQDPRSKPLSSLSQVSISNQPVAIIVGHETEGVSKEALDAADVIVELPMYGVNISLNVMVSTGIVVYKLLEGYEGK